MSSTSTLCVDQFADDLELATQVLKRPVSGRDQLWFARVMPILRKHIEGVSVAALRAQLRIDTSDKFFGFIEQLFKAGVIWYGRPGHKQTVYESVGPIRLSPNFWLKDMVREQALPCTAYSVD